MSAFCAFCLSAHGPFHRDAEGYLSCTRCDSERVRPSSTFRPAYTGGEGAPINSVDASRGERNVMGDAEYERAAHIRKTWGLRIPRRAR